MLGRKWSTHQAGNLYISMIYQILYVSHPEQEVTGTWPPGGSGLVVQTCGRDITTLLTKTLLDLITSRQPRQNSVFSTC